MTELCCGSKKKGGHFVPSGGFSGMIKSDEDPEEQEGDFPFNLLNWEKNLQIGEKVTLSFVEPVDEIFEPTGKIIKIPVGHHDATVVSAKNWELEGEVALQLGHAVHQPLPLPWFMNRTQFRF